LNLVSIHAGLEHVNYPAYHDILMARQWSKICPLIYHGHHPHVLQGVEYFNNSLLAYSLGNFCFDDVYTSSSNKPLVELSENNKTSVIIGLEVENGNLLSYEMTGIYMGKEKLEIGSSEISTTIDKYASAFNDSESVYTENRNNLFSDYISARKSMRDTSWYLKRLNLKSAKMIIRSLYNARQHKKNVINYTVIKK
jgi:poly-gamma-glutamate synthesis protein (capsule biosynthesis protein)